MSRSLPSLMPKEGGKDSSGVLFGRSADDMLVALVGDCAFAMVPARDGRHYLASGWRIKRPMAEWSRDDFYGHGGELADAAAFRGRVIEQAEHQRERKALGRRAIQSRAHTPWGPSQGATIYGDGVESHSTAGHGGFKLSAERNRKVHPMLRAAGGWYEEDECWAIVAITFPDLVTAFERRCAEQTIRDSFPEAWETIFGVILASGESRTKDRRAFEAQHAHHWIVVSAVTSEQRPGFVECVAIEGGRQGQGGEERRVLVPTAEYGAGPFGFVINADRQDAYDGPSRFIGWQGGAVTAPPAIEHRISRLEEDRRQIQRQLDLIDRQIIRRMTGLIPTLAQRRMAYRRGKVPDPVAFLLRYRAQLSALTAERQSEIDTLSRDGERLEKAIAALRSQDRELA